MAAGTGPCEPNKSSSNAPAQSAGIVVGAANSSPRQRPLNGQWRRTCISHSPASHLTLLPKTAAQPQHPKKELTTFLQDSFHLHSRLPRSHQHSLATTAQRIFQLNFPFIPSRPIQQWQQTPNFPARCKCYYPRHFIVLYPSLSKCPITPISPFTLYTTFTTTNSITNASHHMSFPPFLPSNSET